MPRNLAFIAVALRQAPLSPSLSPAAAAATAVAAASSAAPFCYGYRNERERKQRQRGDGGVCPRSYTYFATPCHSRPSSPSAIRDAAFRNGKRPGVLLADARRSASAPFSAFSALLVLSRDPRSRRRDLQDSTARVRPVRSFGLHCKQRMRSSIISDIVHDPNARTEQEIIARNKSDTMTNDERSCPNAARHRSYFRSEVRDGRSDSPRFDRSGSRRTRRNDIAARYNVDVG